MLKLYTLRNDTPQIRIIMTLSVYNAIRAGTSYHQLELHRKLSPIRFLNFLIVVDLLCVFVSLGHVIICIFIVPLQEDMKKIDKSKKKLSNARLDMDSARGR